MSNLPDASAAKPTDEWVTGDEPMTGPQRSYLHTLAREAGEDVRDDLTKAEASEMIERLQERTGRGGEHVPAHEEHRGADIAEPVVAEGIVDQQAMVLGDLDQAD